MIHPSNNTTHPKEPPSGPQDAPLALITITLPTHTPPSYEDFLQQANYLDRLARSAIGARKLAIRAANKLLAAGCAPGSHYLKDGKYLVVRQRIKGKDIRRYVGADEGAQAQALKPFHRYRAYLEILDLISILDRLIDRLLRHTKDICTTLESEIITLNRAERSTKKP